MAQFITLTRSDAAPVIKVRVNVTKIVRYEPARTAGGETKTRIYFDKEEVITVEESPSVLDDLVTAAAAANSKGAAPE